MKSPKGMGKNMVKTITLRYRRPPDNIVTYVHELLKDMEDLIVQRFTFPNFSKEFLVDGEKVLDEGYTGIYFEFVDDWHDIIKVHDREGKFVGYYCDINTPIIRIPGGYSCTDLFLDLWVFPDMRHFVLDRDEFEEAVANGWLTDEEEQMAEETLAMLIDDVKAGRFPPAVVKDWE